MSHTELDRFGVITRVRERRLTQVEAARMLNLGVRQVQRLCVAVAQQGADDLVSRKRGRPSSRRLPDQFRRAIVTLISAHYSDFGPTLASEKLLERHKIKVSNETVRKLMIQAGIWQTRAQRKPKVQQPRLRRPCFGELIQIDGSDHRWFEDRAKPCVLLVFIDDATGQLVGMHFCHAESTFEYMNVTKRYLLEYGKPVAFYSDKHAVFRVNKAGSTRGEGITQFGRAVHDLNIESICANSPAAKACVSYCLLFGRLNMGEHGGHLPAESAALNPDGFYRFVQVAATIAAFSTQESLLAPPMDHGGTHTEASREFGSGQ